MAIPFPQISRFLSGVTLCCAKAEALSVLENMRLVGTRARDKTGRMLTTIGSRFLGERRYDDPGGGG